LKKILAARKPKNFCYAGLWAVAKQTPMAQSKKKFFGLRAASLFFKKEVLFFLPWGS